MKFFTKPIKQQSESTVKTMDLKQNEKEEILT